MLTKLISFHYPERGLRLAMMVVLTLSMLAVMVAPVNMTAQAASCTQYYTIKSGDTLASIGAKFGVSWVTLADWNNISNPSHIHAGATICVKMSGSSSTSSTSTQYHPTFSITSVVKGKTVSVKTYNFPPKDHFDVLIGKMGTKGVNGVLVDTVGSDGGGTLYFTFDIPSSLAKQKQLAIRMESPTSDYFAYNWFWNSTGSGGGTTTTQPIPTFSITAVVRNQTVTIQTKNLPKNDTFTVTMGLMGTKGINGTVVDSVSSGSGGTKTYTFDIPSNLKGKKQIAIRMQSPTSGFFAYNWFWNNTYP